MISFLQKRIETLKKSRTKGFTLIELLVTITIFVVLTGVVLFSQSNFDNTVLLSNLAYDTALTVRQAQTYGVNTREAPLGGFSNTSGITYSYGVFFDTNSTANQRNFILFADTGNGGTGDPDGIYNNSVGVCLTQDPECIQKYSIKRGSLIKSLCAGDDKATCTQVPQLTVLFKRPNPDAKIYINNDSSVAKNYAEITVSSINNATSTIIVTSVGQIYVQKK